MFRNTVSAVALAAVLSLVPNTTAFAEGHGKPHAKYNTEQKVEINNDYWWPNRLDLSALRLNAAKSDPMDAGFNYAAEFAKLDLEELRRDVVEAMTTSQDWWPADYGHYGPFFIRMAWHSAGTYRTTDGRGGSDGGMQRFAPLNSWPDNVNLDKARRLLWPIKQKYGKKISWGDLMVFAGTIAMEDMGFKTLGFAGGRIDGWQPEEVYWGSEGEWLGRDRDTPNGLENPLAAVRMGLIYVNPEGPNGVPEPLLAAKEIRETFARMAMNDEETAALIAGGHTFGKAHGARSPEKCVGPDAEAAPIENQGLGWKNKCGTGKGADTITSGLEGAWTAAPTQWTTLFLQNLYQYDWKKTKSPAGATQWTPTDESASDTVPDAHIEGKFHAPIMFTTDLALRFDPEYQKITTRWLENPEEFEQAFARAWFKLTHRDLGPRSRYLGAFAPKDEMIWQDPIPAVDYDMISARDAAKLKKQILESGLSVSELVRAAWSSASSFRNTDMRGGANGARVRLAPQKDWAANTPVELDKVITKLEAIQTSFNSKNRKKQVSLADLVVLGGAAALEKAAADAGVEVSVPFTPGRADATQAKTDVHSFSFLKPKADGFRNYFAEGNKRSPAEMLVEKSAVLNLSVPEMTVLVGGMRALDANTDGAKHGVFTDKPGTLNNDFFVNLLSMDTEWKKAQGKDGIFNGYDRASGQMKWTATPVDLIFGSNSELRAIAEVYAFDENKEKFVNDFIKAWVKVMNNDRS